MTVGDFAVACLIAGGQMVSYANQVSEMARATVRPLHVGHRVL